MLNDFKEEMKNIKHCDKAIDSQKLWKIKIKFCPQVNDPPSAMLDGQGNLLTSDEAIKTELWKCTLIG